MTSRQGTRKSPMAGSKKGKSTLRGGLGAVGGKKPKQKYTTTFQKSKKAALKDKGKPNTPGEKGRTFKGKVTAGRVASKKMLRGDFDIGKKLRYQRRGK